MTIPIQFVDGLAYFDIACEGFVGYIPADTEIDLTFARIYIVIDGVGELPGGGNDEEVVPTPGATQTLFTVVANEKTFVEYAAFGENSLIYSGAFEVVANEDSGYFVTYIGANALVQGATTYTVSMIQLSEFFVSFFEQTIVEDAFTNTTITLDQQYMATNVELSINTHNGHPCVGFTLDDSSTVYLYFEDMPYNGPEELPEDTIFTITIGSETLTFEDFMWDEGGYIAMLTQNASELVQNNVITATLTTNLDGEFELADETTFSVTPNVPTEISIIAMQGMYAIAYDNQTYFFAFMFADNM